MIPFSHSPPLNTCSAYAYRFPLTQLLQSQPNKFMSTLTLMSVSTEAFHKERSGLSLAYFRLSTQLKPVPQFFFSFVRKPRGLFDFVQPRFPLPKQILGNWQKRVTGLITTNGNAD